MYLTPAWQEDVRRALKAQSMTQEQLAAKIGAVKASITNMLKPGAKMSRYADAVSKELGIKLPAKSNDTLTSRWISAGEELRRRFSAEEFEKQVEKFERILKDLNDIDPDERE